MDVRRKVSNVCERLRREPPKDEKMELPHDDGVGSFQTLVDRGSNPLPCVWHSSHGLGRAGGPRDSHPKFGRITPPGRKGKSLEARRPPSDFRAGWGNEVI